MRKVGVIAGTLWAITLTGLMSGCDDPQSNIPTRPSTPGVSSISVSGPAGVAPGQSAQFSAALRFADGTIKTVTAAPNLRWRSSNTAILQVTTAGIVTATQQRGQVTLSADWTSPSRTGGMEVVVVPDGTFRVVGNISEVDAPAAVIANARVEATGGLVTTTGSNGAYQLFGVPPDATIRVTADGYLPAERQIQLTGHTVQNFPMTLSGPRLMVAGFYTLALDLVGPCPGTRPLPVDLQHRTYEALVTQTGSLVEVLLTEPRFRLNSTSRGNRFFGRATASIVTFTLEIYNDYYYGYYGPTAYPSIAERLPNGTYLVPAGTAATTGSGTALSGQMNVFLSNWGSTFPNGTFLGSCSGPLQFALTRR